MPRKLSRRAIKTWDRLGQWYGARLQENYGPTPPDDWAELIDRTDDERLLDALLAVRRASPIHPPTLGQIESAIPKREFRNEGPSKPDRLATLMLSTHDLCQHQLAKTWNYFGPMREFERLPKQVPPAFITHPDPRGVQVPPCESCDRPSYRVLLENAITEGVAA